MPHGEDVDPLRDPFGKTPPGHGIDFLFKAIEATPIGVGAQGVTVSKLTLRTALRSGVKGTIGTASKALRRTATQEAGEAVAKAAKGVEVRGLLSKFKGPLTALFGVAGYLTFNAFIAEETSQQLSFAESTAAKAEDQALVASIRQEHERLLGDLAGEVVLPGQSFLSYFNSARMKLEASQALMSKQRADATAVAEADPLLKEPPLTKEEEQARKLDPESFDTLKNKTLGLPPVGQDTQVAPLGEGKPAQFAEQRKELRRRKEAETAFTEVRPLGGIAPNKQLEDFGTPESRPAFRDPRLAASGTPKTPETPVKKEKGGGPPGGFTPLPPFEAAKAEEVRKKRRRTP